MKTVQDYRNLGLVLADGDELSSAVEDGWVYKKSESHLPLKYHGVVSFAWRNNDGAKPEYNGAMKVELSSGDVIFNCGKTSEFDWRINDNVNPKILRWKPIVISDGMAGRGYRFAINECQKPSFLQYKPKINLIMPDSLKAEVRRVGSEVNVTISQKDKQENAVNNLEQVIGIDEVCDAIKQVSPKEDKPMKPVYTAEMHAKNELPQVGAKCIYVFNDDEQYVGEIAAMDGDACWFKRSEFGYKTFIGKHKFKPIIKTIKVNGFDVPAPMSEAPEVGSEYFVIDMLDDGLFCPIEWDGDDKDNQWLSKGIIHSTESAAIAHAKAMLGINPNPARGGDGYDRNVLGQNNEGDEI